VNSPVALDFALPEERKGGTPLTVTMAARGTPSSPESVPDMVPTPCAASEAVIINANRNNIHARQTDPERFVT
jgi:hypothetical protein